jgi:hypothetical protein
MMRRSPGVELREARVHDAAQLERQRGNGSAAGTAPPGWTCRRRPRPEDLEPRMAARDNASRASSLPKVVRTKPGARHGVLHQYTAISAQPSATLPPEP